MIKLFDNYVTEAIKKAEKSLARIFQYRLKNEDIPDWEIAGAFEAGKVAKVVFDAIRQDGLNHGTQSGREFPIHIGDASDFTSYGFPKAKIYLVDSTTYGEEENWGSKTMAIQAKSIRPFLPFRGVKNDSKYVRYIRPFLDGNDIEDPDRIAGVISRTNVKGGQYRPVDNFVFRQYAPKISLLYCNWDKFDRKILMLRPSNRELNGIAYRAYCDVVTDAIRLRHGWDIDFDTIRWSRYGIANSMAVADSQLMAIKNQLVSNETRNIDTDNTSLLRPMFLLKTAA